MTMGCPSPIDVSTVQTPFASGSGEFAEKMRRKIVRARDQDICPWIVFSGHHREAAPSVT